MDRAQISPPARIFEVGFGPGRFMRWARSKGFRVSGCEIVELYVLDALADNFEALHRDGIAALTASDCEFDAIVLFDVLEHMTLHEISELLAVAQARLVRGGKVIARFPNGSSPFARHCQYGDATHISVLTPALISQLLPSGSLEMAGYWNSARSYRVRRLRSVGKLVSLVIRDVVEILISYAYFGARTPLDPNITVVLVKRDG